MRDDDRRLAERLARYESRIPVDAGPPTLVESARVPWAALGAVAAAAVVAVVLATGALGDQRDVGEASPSPSASPTSAATPVATASPTPSASVAATPTPASHEPTPTPTSGPIVRWAPVGVFGSEGWAEEVADMTYAAGHFIAVGYREPDDQRGHVGPPIDEPRIWISADGGTWEQVVLGSAFDSGHLRTVVALADGSAVVYGSIAPEPPGNQEPAAWRTTDGRTWTRLALSLPHDRPLSHVVGGRRGLITTVSLPTEESQTEEIWHSVDGATWTVAHRLEPRDGFLPALYDWEAGPEGFVVTGYRYRFVGDEREDRTFVLASGDGREWFEAAAEETPFSAYTGVASIGGDWLIAANGTAEGDWTSRATTWFSTNGLAWEERTLLEIPMPSSPLADEVTSTVVGRVVSTEERVIASGSVVICCHGPWWAAGVWSTFDGRSWERLGFPDGTVVSAAAQHDGIVVLGGFDRARPEDEFKTRAVFWIGERR